jgi:tetratricopeptide (TPR) repeat protein
VRAGRLASAGGLAAVALVTVQACTTAVTAPGRAEVNFPSPLAGPGRPEISASERRRVDEAWHLLLSGQLAAAREEVERARGTVQGRLLTAQIDLLAGEPDSRPAVEEITRQHPRYAAAWMTLSWAAEQEGQEAQALEAARIGGDLWHGGPWARRAMDLQMRFVEQRLSLAGDALDADDPARALELLDRVLALEPENRHGLLLTARALIKEGDSATAEEVLARLPSDPDALHLAAQIAEDRKDWLTAMDLYESLPEGYPERDADLKRASLNWRLANLPTYVQNALRAPSLSRSQLAVLLVSLAPQIESISGGRVPLLQDIVDLPSYREILTAVRLELLEIDPLEHRFFPDRDITDDEVREAISGLSHLLGQRPPLWCTPETEDRSSCLDLPVPASGDAVAELVLRIAQGEQL